MFLNQCEFGYNRYQNERKTSVIEKVAICFEVRLSIFVKSLGAQKNIKNKISWLILGGMPNSDNLIYYYLL